jgi:hypothetical protein
VDSKKIESEKKPPVQINSVEENEGLSDNKAEGDSASQKLEKERQEVIEFKRNLIAQQKSLIE